MVHQNDNLLAFSGLPAEIKFTIHFEAVSKMRFLSPS